MRLRWTKHALSRVRRRATTDIKKFRQEVQNIFDKKNYLDLHLGPNGGGFAYFKWRDLTYKIYLKGYNKVVTIQHGVHGKSLKNLH